MIKRVFGLLSLKSAVIFFCIFMATTVSAVTFPDSPKPFRYVNDYTNTLSEKQLDALEAKLVAYGKETSSQIAVVIVPTTGEYEISQYAFELGDKWGIGRKNLNNGVLLLIAKDDRKLFIAVGQGLQGVLTDALASQIIRNQIRPYFRNEQYAQGIDNGLDYIIAATKGEFAAQAEEENDFGDFVPFIMLALFILIVVMAEMNSRRPYVTPTNNHVLNDVLRKSMSDRRRNGRDGGGFGGGFGGLNALQVGDAVEQSFESFLAGLQGLVREIHRSAIVGREDEETNGHGRIGLFERGMCAVEELFERNEVAQALSHLLSIDGYHVVVHPITHHLFAFCGHSLGNFALVVWENKVHSAAMYVELFAQILAAHCRTLAVPTRETLAPRTGPAHDVFGLGAFPQGEVGLIALFAHAVELS